MKIKFLKDIGEWKAGQTIDCTPEQASWLLPKGLAEAAIHAEPVKDEFDDFLEPEPKPTPKPKAKFQHQNKMAKAPENK